ncbi:C-type lectin 37Db-like [Zeugodacus cucurbitae]|uniref:C-type lectin 37Db-like n=1 Tax=Zeugodacus cucurbitae TaxID=28588 RepID=UPI0005968EDA|nr:C-type lectin 37Db-like [Zeugodacus cucurbitae]
MANLIKISLLCLNILAIFTCSCGSTNAENTESNCPFVKIGSKYYFINESLKMSWFESSEYCRSIGGDLVNINSIEELLALQKYILGMNIQTQLWTDGNDLGREGRYMSLTTGRPLFFTKWKPNNPDNSNNEDCVEVRIENKTLVMNDHKCDMEFYAICQYREPTTHGGSKISELNENDNLKLLRNLGEALTHAADVYKSCSQQTGCPVS